MLLHHLFCNAIVIWFWRSVEFVRFECKISFDVHCSSNGIYPGPPIPDAVFLVSTNERHITLFIEADMGTECDAVVRDKFASYREIFADTDSFLLFIQAKTFRDVERIQGLANQEGIEQQFVCTTFAQNKALNPITENIWRHSDGLDVSLVELFFPGNQEMGEIA
jgi:hypothetical protein